MFFKRFSFIFYARTIKPALTFEYFGSVFSKLKLSYKFLIGFFILMLARIFHVHVCSWKTTFSVLRGLFLVENIKLKLIVWRVYDYIRSTISCLLTTFQDWPANWQMLGKNEYVIYLPRSVCIGKNYARALNLEYGPRPAALGRTQDHGHSVSLNCPPGR